jgi:cytochrome oxidase Cu insertion factor (SCO1/SenC/PrrC family)
VTARRALIAIGVLIAVCGATAALAATHGGGGAAAAPPLRGEAVWTPGSRPAPGFSLTDQHGRPISLASMRGAPLMVVFLDSKCRTLCPVVGHQLGAAERRLSHPVRLVAISVDTGDTAASVRTAAREWRWSGDWTWLMGTHAQLSPVWRAYGISVRPTDKDITHSIAVYLIDARGNERAGFLQPLAMPDLLYDLRLLQAEAAGGA